MKHIAAILCLVFAACSQGEKTTLTDPNGLLSKPQYRYSQQNVEALCREMWTTRGILNERTYRYWLQQEKEAYGKLEHLVGQHSDLQWISVVLQRAWEEWTKRGITDYRLVHHHMDREVEGYLNVQYERQQPDFDEHKMSLCIAIWKDHDRINQPWSLAFRMYRNESLSTIESW